MTQIITYDAQELFTYSGRLVFITDTDLVGDTLTIVDFPYGKPEKIQYQTLSSATPEDLEEAGI